MAKVFEFQTKKLATPFLIACKALNSTSINNINNINNVNNFNDSNVRPD